MIDGMFNLLFCCRHRRLTRPITPVHKPTVPAPETYVACLDCGKRFHYDLKNMRVGMPIAGPAPMETRPAAPPNLIRTSRVV